MAANKDRRIVKTPQAALFALLLLAALGAPAAHADRITTYGVGLESCQTYLVARDGHISEEVRYVDWLSGYFSGINSTSTHRNNHLGLADVGYALQRLDEHCRAQPELRFAVAASTLVLGAKPGPAAHTLEPTSYGTADAACQAFLDAREQKEAEYWTVYSNWLGGYLSGVNLMSLHSNSVLGDAQLLQAMQWLDDYCTSHPVTPFSAAVAELINDRSIRLSAAGGARSDTTTPGGLLKVAPRAAH